MSPNPYIEEPPGGIVKGSLVATGAGVLRAFSADVLRAVSMVEADVAAAETGEGGGARVSGKTRGGTLGGGISEA